MRTYVEIAAIADNSDNGVLSLDALRAIKH